ERGRVWDGQPPNGTECRMVCQNGGTYDGIKCRCLSDFYGPMCEYSSESITTAGTIVANVELVVTVINFNYTEELQDPRSEVYESFEKQFRQEMAKIYGSVPGYQGVKILSIRPVDHEVIFSTVASPNLSEEFQKKTQELLQKLKETAESQGDCLGGWGVPTESHAPPESQRTPPPHLTPSCAPSSALCQQLAPIGYQDYYYAMNVSNILRCVTNCTANTPGTINCNYGECHVTRAGPQCFCHDESLYWYTGSRCSGRISKVATGLGVAVTVLLIACITLTVLVVIQRKRGKQPRLLPQPHCSPHRPPPMSPTGDSLRSFTASQQRVNTNIPVGAPQDLCPPPCPPTTPQPPQAHLTSIPFFLSTPTQMQITRPSVRPRL
uniref:SEA domain-containing protein n=1 Tax=Anas platyrhynchos platyrhynchos TaxID=8840 RepID=U3IE76_ANAPP